MVTLHLFMFHVGMQSFELIKGIKMRNWNDKMNIFLFKSTVKQTKPNII